MTDDEIISRIRYSLEQVMIGNSQPLFDLMSETVVWNAPSPINAPWSGTHRGKQAFREQILAGPDRVDFEMFDLIDVFGSGNRYAALVHERYKAKMTGRLVDQDALFLFRTEDGEVVEYEEFCDTDQISRAFET